MKFKKIKLLLVGSLFAVQGIFTSCEEASAQDVNDSCYQIIVGESEVDDVREKQLQVDCPTNMFATGAGWSVLDETGAILEGHATYFQPSFDGASWLTNAKNLSTFEPDWKLRVRLICTCVE